MIGIVDLTDLSCQAHFTGATEGSPTRRGGEEGDAQEGGEAGFTRSDGKGWPITGLMVVACPNLIPRPFRPRGD